MKEISVSEHAGGGTGWGGALPLRQAYPGRVVLDLRPLRFVVPTFLLRLRTFVDWHRSRGREVVVRCPRRVGVNRYLARMRVAAGLPAGTFDGLRDVAEHDRSEALIPIKRLSEFPDLDSFAADLAPVIEAHDPDLAAIAQPLIASISELAGNAIEHGASELGCYVAAQRYASRGSLQLALGDLGGGIPHHLRGQHPDIRNDGQAIRYALQEGISGTGNAHRGFGLPTVIEELAGAATIPHAELRIRSGYGGYRGLLTGSRFQHLVAPTPVGFKRGTWIALDLGTVR